MNTALPPPGSKESTDLLRRLNMAEGVHPEAAAFLNSVLRTADRLRAKVVEWRRHHLIGCSCEVCQCFDTSMADTVSLEGTLAALAFNLGAAAADIRGKVAEVKAVQLGDPRELLIARLRDIEQKQAEQEKEGGAVT